MELENYRITSFNVINKATFEKHENIRFNYNHRILNYTDSVCNTEGNVILSLEREKDLTDKTFYVKMTIQGVYSHNNEGKKEIQEKSTNELLLFLRSHIASALAAISMDPIIIPLENIKEVNQNINNAE